MIVLDASFVIALLSHEDPHNAAATERVRAAGGESLVMHPMNLAEVLVGGVRAGRGREMAADLRGIGIDVAYGDQWDPLRLAELRVHTGLKLPDCCALLAALPAVAPGAAAVGVAAPWAKGSQASRVTAAREVGGHVHLATFDAALAEAARLLHVRIVP